MNTTPVVIVTMLECYYLGSPQQHFDRRATPAQTEALASLAHHGLIDGSLRATEAGVAWIKMLLATPLPVKMTGFYDPRTDQLIVV